MNRTSLLAVFTLIAGTHAFAQSTSTKVVPPPAAQVIALDECDPTTFNAVLGPDFCKNVSLGSFTTFDDLFAKAAAGKPDRNWDFEPDVVKIKEGTTLSVTDQGGELHTFTEVARFGGGFVGGIERARGADRAGMCRRFFGS